MVRFNNLLSHTARSALSKLLMVALGALLFMPHRALAGDGVNLVVMVDFSKSVAVADHAGQSECEKNLQAVATILAEVPAGSHVKVLGITDNSFAQPDILLSADVGEDQGYFKERLASARRQLVSAWQKRMRQVESGFMRTDILGALLLAGQMFEQLPKGRRNILVIFSDMRQNTSELNLETARPISIASALAKAKGEDLIADLNGVEVSADGVDNAGMSTTYWEQLRRFWLGYFAKAGAHLENYSVLRESPSSNADQMGIVRP